MKVNDYVKKNCSTWAGDARAKKRVLPRYESPHWQAIEEILQDGPESLQSLADRLGWPKPVVSSMLDRMKKAGKVEPYNVWRIKNSSAKESSQ